MVSTILGATVVTASAPVYYTTKVRPLQNYVQEVGMRQAKLKLGLACYIEPHKLLHGSSHDSWVEVVTIAGIHVTVVHADFCQYA